MSSATTTFTTSTFAIPDRTDVWLMKEVAFLGLKNMDVERIVSHVKQLQSENWCPHIEEPLLRQKLTNIVTAFSTQLQGANAENDVDIQLVQTAIMLGFVDSTEPDDAVQLVQDLMAENWFPYIEESVLRQKLQAISYMFGRNRMPSCGGKMQRSDAKDGHVVNSTGSRHLVF